MSAPPTKCAPAFDFYPERWTHGTRHMTKTERCDYIDLLCHQWTENGLPDDLDMIARLLGYKKPAQIPPLVLEKFPVSDDGRRRNQRLESERVKQIARIDKKRYGAAKTNEKRWGKRPEELSLSDRIATHERVDIESPPPSSDHPPPLLPPTPQGGGRAAKRAPQTEAVDDESWLAGLEADSAYTGIPIRIELGKMQRWCETNRKQPSRRRFVNWLNRAEKPFMLPGMTNGHQPKHPAYTKERATAGLTAEQIGTF